MKCEIDEVPQTIILFFKRIKQGRIAWCFTNKSVVHNYSIHKYEKDCRDSIVMGVLREETMSKWSFHK